ncbi:MAG: hypothetical protein HC790_02245 [Acaryochloridaceae cyanobacterium CSU_3_4]|nr:hypothetical protein [Acaryochloridaceae cyanobacterium CSU_3_4]
MMDIMPDRAPVGCDRNPATHSQLDSLPIRAGRGQKICNNLLHSESGRLIEAVHPFFKEVFLEK